MQIPLEITYLDVDKTDALEALVHEKVAKLEQVCDHMSSCRVGLEKTHDRPKVVLPIEYASTSRCRPDTR